MPIETYALAFLFVLLPWMGQVQWRWSWAPGNDGPGYSQAQPLRQYDAGAPQGDGPCRTRGRPGGRRASNPGLPTANYAGI